jgi:hypothetical protein
MCYLRIQEVSVGGHPTLAAPSILLTDEVIAAARYFWESRRNPLVISFEEAAQAVVKSAHQQLEERYRSCSRHKPSSHRTEEYAELRLDNPLKVRSR